MGEIGDVKLSESKSKGTTVIYQKTAVLSDKGKILLNPKNPVNAARKVEDLIKKELIKVDGDPKKIRADVEKAIREAKGESIALDDIIGYDIENPKELGKELGVASKDAKDPFATEIDEAAHNKIQILLAPLKKAVIDTIK